MKVISKLHANYALNKESWVYITKELYNLKFIFYNNKYI